MKPRWPPRWATICRRRWTNASPHHWRDLGAFDFDPALPAGAKPLSDFVKAPAALARRLAMTGLVFPDQGAALQSTAQARPAPGVGARRSVALGWFCRLRRCAVARRRAPVAAQSPDGAGKRSRSGQAKSAPHAFADYSAAKDAREAAREALRAAEERRTRRRTGADRAPRTRPPAPPAPPPNAPRQLASLESEIRRLTQSVEAAEESRAPGRRRPGGTGRWRRADQQAWRMPAARPPMPAPRPAKRAPRWKAQARRRSPRAPPGRHRRRTDALEHAQGRRRTASRRTDPPPGRTGRRTGRRRSRCREQIAEKRNALLDAIATAETARNEASDAAPAGRKPCWPKPTSTPRPPMPRCPRRARNAPAPRRCRKPPPAASRN